VKTANAKNIVFCIEALTVGGAEQMLVAMANQFVKRGWTVHMVCLTKAGELADNLDTEVELHVLHKKSGVDLRLPKRLRSLIDSINPVAVNSHLWTANLWTRLALMRSKRRVIITEHSRDTWKPFHYRMLDRLLSRVTTKLVAVSNDTADFYRQDIRIPDNKIVVINNGVDTKRYAAGDGTELRQQWAKSVPLLIGTVGRMVPAKNHIRLLDTAVELKNRGIDFKLVFVGDGELRDTVESAVDEKELSDQVILAGTRSDIPDVLAAFDLFILSSDREGHPLTALEAQAAGTPVILTNAGGSADAVAVENGSDSHRVGGLLVEKDPIAIAEAVVQLSQDDDGIKTMGEFAQRHALAHFDMQHMVDQYQRLFTAGPSV